MVEYQPEPPIVVRGSMNPWNDERQRVVWQAEEKAWVTIQAKQSEYRRTYDRLQSTIAQMNSLVSELEGLTGKKMGMFTVQNLASMLAMSSGNPYIIAAMFIKQFVFDAFAAKKKKKKIEGLVQRLESLQAQAKSIVDQLHVLEDTVTTLIATGDAIRNTQQTTITQDMAQSETAYQARQQLDTLRASVLRERIRQAATLPSPPGGTHNDL
jgi:hypothetical protein